MYIYIYVYVYICMKEVSYQNKLNCDIFRETDFVGNQSENNIYHTVKFEINFVKWVRFIRYDEIYFNMGLVYRVYNEIYFQFGSK